MDLTSFAKVMVAGVPLLFVVVGLVEWLKKLGIEGKTLTAASMGIGLLLGGGYMISQGFPSGFAAWFAVVVYGLAMGLVASGLYDTAKNILEKIISKPPELTPPT